MFMCRQVAKALAEQDYETLSPTRKFFLKLHVGLCGMCGKFHRQIMDMQDGVREFRGHEDKEDIPGDIHLPPESRKRVEAALAQAASSSET